MTISEQIKQVARTLFADQIANGHRASTLYEYADKNDTPIYWKVRLEKDGKKFIRPFHNNGEGYQLGEPKLDKKPLYKLADIYRNPDATVFVVEGEKCVHALTRLTLLATTSGASSSAGRADWSPLDQRDVIIWPDKDQGGVQYADAVVLLLNVGRVRIVDIHALDDLGEGDDAADWVERNPKATAEDVLALPMREVRLVLGISHIELINADIPPRQPILGEWLVQSSINMIYSKRGVGKTHLALGVAYAIACGCKFLTWEASGARDVLFIDGEMMASELKARLLALAGSIVEGTKAKLSFITPDMIDGAPMPNIATIEGQTRLQRDIDNHEVVIVDNISCLAGGIEENSAEAWDIVQQWATRLKAAGKTVIFIHHAGMSGDQRGTTKREDVLDVSMQLKHPPDYQDEDGAHFEIRFAKARHIKGDAKAPIEARLDTDESGGQVWSTKSLKLATKERVWQLYRDGLNSREIAEELQIDRSTVTRHIKNGKALGYIKSKDPATNK